MNNRVGISRTLLKPFLQFCVIASALAGAAQAQTGRLWVTADFNGDNKADVVTITASEPAATGHTLRFAPLDAAAYAHDLYAALRQLDAAKADVILIETVPDDDAWLAVRDRLLRATHGEDDDRD